MTPPRWLVINPNTNFAITRALEAEIGRHAPPGTHIEGATGAFGFPVIATRASFAIAAHAALDAYARHAGECDAIILGCFGDPGLAALREIAAVPVVALAEASFAVVTGPFAVLTAGPGWPAMLREQIALLPCASLCRGVWALEANGAAVRDDPASFFEALDRLAAEAVAAGATCLILGGAVLAGYASRLRPIVPFIDCVQAAVTQIASTPTGARVLQPAPTIGLSPPLRDRLAGCGSAQLA